MAFVCQHTNTNIYFVAAHSHTLAQSILNCDWCHAHDRNHIWMSVALVSISQNHTRFYFPSRIQFFIMSIWLYDPIQAYEICVALVMVESSLRSWRKTDRDAAETGNARKSPEHRNMTPFLWLVVPIPVVINIMIVIIDWLYGSASMDIGIARSLCVYACQKPKTHLHNILFGDFGFSTFLIYIM